MSWSNFYRRLTLPRRLRIRGRPRLPTTSFCADDRLYHAVVAEELDEHDRPKVETVRFPDFSCNWSRFSEPADVRLRENGRREDGCYSFTVSTAQYKAMATPVHDPLSSPTPNYSHVEVRELEEGEPLTFEPPKNRKGKSKSSKARRLEYRQHLANHTDMELQPRVPQRSSGAEPVSR